MPGVYKIGQVYISAVNLQIVVDSIINAVKKGFTDFICVSNVYTVGIANKQEVYQEVMNSAMMCLPDGMPLVWMAKLWGLKSVERTSGPALFSYFMKHPENGIKHFLLGDTNETLEGVKRKYPEALVVGTYSPPFEPLENYDMKGIANMINESDANIVWVSLKAPKQDFFSKAILSYLEGKICIGVGAAFRQSLGEYKMPPTIIQKMGLTGLLWRKDKLGLLIWDVKQLWTVAKWSIGILKVRFIHGDSRQENN